MQRKDAVRAFTGQTKELQGPDGVCSPQTNRDLSVILRYLERLKKSFDYVNANYAEAFRLSSLTTFYVENFFFEMRQEMTCPSYFSSVIDFHRKKKRNFRPKGDGRSGP